MQRGGKGIGAGAIEPGQRRIARKPGGKSQYGVAGRGVAVDGDAAKGLLVGRAEQLLQERGSNRAVGENIAQHRRHIGRNHPAAFDNRGERNGASVDDRSGCGALGKGVGRADRVGGVLPAARRGEHGRGNPGFGFVERQGHPDHPGRADEYLFLRAVQLLRDPGHDRLDRRAPAVAGKGVGIARVDHQRACAALHHIGAAQLYLGRAADVAGEHPCHCRAWSERNIGQITPPPILVTRARNS